VTSVLNTAVVYGFAGLLRKFRQQVFSYHPELLLDLCDTDYMLRDGVKEYVRSVLLSEDTYDPDCRRSNPRAMKAVFQLTCRYQMEDVLPKILPWIVYEAREYLDELERNGTPPRFLNAIDSLRVGRNLTLQFLISRSSISFDHFPRPRRSSLL
jgi:hypothetical protein